MTKTVLSSLLFVSILAPTAFATDPIYVGHRALIHEAPENTLPAFVTATQLGIGIELDVRTSQDGELVVIHDHTIGRTTDGPDLPVSQLTLAELKSYDAGSWQAPRFAGIKIPTFEESLAAIAQHKAGPTILAINIKQVTVAGEQTLVDLVEQYDLLEESYAFDISSESGERMKAINPNFRIGETVRSSAELDQAIADGLPDALHLGDFMPSVQQVDQMRQAGTQSILNIARHPDDFSQLNPATWLLAQQRGLDGILTNHPVDGIETYGQTKAVVNLFLEVDEVAKTWEATAEVVGAGTSGIAAIDFDVVSSGGIDVTSSTLLPLDPNQKLLPLATGTYMGNVGTLSISGLASSTGMQPDAGGDPFAPEAMNGRTVLIGAPGNVTGDMDCDGDVDFDDIDDFVLALNDPAAYLIMYGVPPELKGDTDDDGDSDFDDIPGFVVLLSGGIQSSIPEPSTGILLGLGVAGLVGFRCRQRIRFSLEDESKSTRAAGSRSQTTD